MTKRKCRIHCLISGCFTLLFLWFLFDAQSMEFETIRLILSALYLMSAIMNLRSALVKWGKLRELSLK
jgi:hypothetical protein